MPRAKDPSEMDRQELVHALNVIEARLCPGASASRRSGSTADLALELRYIKKATAQSP